jgi:hypothetical protein
LTHSDTGIVVTPKFGITAAMNHDATSGRTHPMYRAPIDYLVWRRTMSLNIVGDWSGITRQPQDVESLGQTLALGRNIMNLLTASSQCEHARTPASYGQDVSVLQSKRPSDGDSALPEWRRSAKTFINRYKYLATEVMTFDCIADAQPDSQIEVPRAQWIHQIQSDILIIGN